MQQRWFLTCFFAVTLWSSARSQDPTETLPTQPPITRSAPELAFDGVQFFTKEQIEASLRFELQAWTEGRPLPIIADDCAYQIEALYRSQGFHAVEVHVQPLVQPLGLGIKVVEGERLVIAEWVFEGAVDEAGLNPIDLSSLYGSESPLPLDEQRLSKLPDKVEARYVDRGYLDVHVETKVPTTLALAGARRVHLVVEPGIRYRLADIEHDLAPEIAAQVELDRVLRKVTDSDEPHPYYQPPWQPRWVRAAQNELGRVGYLDVRVQSERIQRDGQVTVRLSIDPGPRVRLHKLLFPPDLKVRDRFLQHYMGLSPGQWLSAEDLDNAVVGLYRTGRFETVRVSVDGEGPERNVVLQATEQAQREAFLEPGYGSFEHARLRIGWRHHNLGGVARSLRVEGVLAENAERILLGWNDPWTLGNDWVLDANWDNSLRKLPAYRRSTNTLSVFASRSFGRLHRWNTDVGVRSSRIGVSDVRADLIVDPVTGVDLTEDLTSTTIEWGLAYDSRNHPLLPRSGQVASLTMQQALAATGSAPRYLQVQMGWAGFRKLTEHQTLGVGLRLAAIMPEGDGELPLALRLFSGGENTVRSFREDQLGPRDSTGTPTGGEGRSTLSVEWLRDLGASHWQLAGFVDVGNVVASAPDLLSASDLETGIGVGLRYILPIGPVRIDWGFNPNAERDQPDSVLHISVGMAF